MEEINSDLIARIATRLYNAVSRPQAFPGNVADVESVAREVVNPVREETSARGIPFPDAVNDKGGQQGEGVTLDEITQVIEKLKANPARSVPGELTDQHFVQSSTLGKGVSLNHHAEKLVHQQTLHQPAERYGGLKEFVSGIQSCRYDPTGNASGDGPLADPFSVLLRASLPARSKLAGHTAFNVHAIRRDFPILQQKVNGKPLVWFDNAATTQKPKVVIDTLNHYYTHYNSNIHRGAHTLATRATDAFEEARDKIRDYLNAGHSSEIIFVRGATEGINLVAQSYGKKFIGHGDEIVLSELEHHANIVPWQIIARERGALLRVIPMNDRGEILLDEYEKLLGPRSRVVALSHASNSLGTIVPVHEMIQMARRYGAHVLIDGAQSVAHLPVDVQALDCDFFAFSGHKIFGPTGIGALYGKKELLEIMPPWQAGGNMIRDVTFEETIYNDGPAKFEAGTPTIADAVGLGVALDYVRGIGLVNIAAHEQKLLEHATEQLSRINGLRLIGTAREKVGVTSFVLKDKPSEEVGRYLDRHGIAVRAGHHCAQPSLRRFGLEATVRPSFSLYNTFDEVDRLVYALKGIS